MCCIESYSSKLRCELHSSFSQQSNNRDVLFCGSISCFNMAGLSLVTTFTIALSLYVLKKLCFGHEKNITPLPPGPKGLPLFGNLADLPPPGTPEHLHWLKHKDVYGPISSVTILGQKLIILNDKDASFELKDKQASIYSGRPRMKFAEMYVDLRCCTLRILTFNVGVVGEALLP